MSTPNTVQSEDPRSRAPAAPLPVAPVKDPLAFQLSRARTAYNYMRSYPGLEAVPLCASLPASEALSTAYNALVLRSGMQIAQNFLPFATRIVLSEIEHDARTLQFTKVMQDIQAAWNGLLEVTAESLQGGVTAFLKSTLFDVLRPPDGKTDKDFLQAECEAQYTQLLESLPRPLMLSIENAAWMPKPAPGRPQDLPCEQDWFFGYLQVAGFNTSNLRGVVLESKPGEKTISIEDLRTKIGLTTDILRSVSGDKKKTLEDAVREGLLYACDYTHLVDPNDPRGADSFMHGKRRYMPSPIAVFYWNANQPAGFPKDASGVLQPIAIKLELRPDAPIFTPNDCAQANDESGYKWKIAKYFVNIACAIQHESVAHLGDCHFIMDAVAVATHRQLPTVHPLFKLLEPHLRFTLALNHGALNNLVIPGGVVATNVGPDIHWTLKLVNDARKVWRWDENHPEGVFALRGVDEKKLPVFPFRDDTLLIWQAIEKFVARYVDHHYADDDALAADVYLGNWLEELRSPQYADLKGLPKPATRRELSELVAQMIYTAGPLHASVNYAQYPLGAYIPAVSATIYGPPPTRETKIDDSNVVDWFAPLDIALYTISFQYLLSSIQYDVFGHYSENPQFPYFAERELQHALEDFQSELARAEATINARNRERPVPYPFQLPSRIPNSVSI